MDNSRVATLAGDSIRVQLQFLYAHLALASTFVRLAHTEIRMDDREAAENLLAKTEMAYAGIAEHLQLLSLIVPVASTPDEIGRSLGFVRDRRTSARRRTRATS